MKFTKYVALFVFFALSFEVFAVPLRVVNRDMKLRTQQLIEKQTITNPAVAAADDVLADDAGNTSAAAATQTTFVAQPDVPRNLS